MCAARERYGCVMVSSLRSPTRPVVWSQLGPARNRFHPEDGQGRSAPRAACQFDGYTLKKKTCKTSALCALQPFQFAIVPVCHVHHSQLQVGAKQDALVRHDRSARLPRRQSGLEGVAIDVQVRRRSVRARSGASGFVLISFLAHVTAADRPIKNRTRSTWNCPKRSMLRLLVTLLGVEASKCASPKLMRARF